MSVYRYQPCFGAKNPEPAAVASGPLGLGAANSCGKLIFACVCFALVGLNLVVEGGAFQTEHHMAGG